MRDFQKGRQIKGFAAVGGDIVRGFHDQRLISGIGDGVAQDQFIKNGSNW